MGTPTLQLLHQVLAAVMERIDFRREKHQEFINRFEFLQLNGGDRGEGHLAEIHEHCTSRKMGESASRTAAAMRFTTRN